MPNKSSNAYALMTLCPLMPQSGGVRSPSTMIRELLDETETDHNGPMAGVPNTYLCRFFVLDDVIYQGKPAIEEHLRSKYLVFAAEFHGDLEPYLLGMWRHAQQFVRDTWKYCVGFEKVTDAKAFVGYIKLCQVTTTFFFNGSNDESLAEQLKGLYLKQELSKFAYQHQGLTAEALQAEFRRFVMRVKPYDLRGPTWRAGASNLEDAVVDGS